MERKAAYAVLAKWFEYLNDDCGYDKWSQSLIETLQAYPVRTGLDIGCGGGWFTRAFQRAGYEVTGLDVSAEMLNEAQKAASKEGLRGRYLLGDITRFRSPEKYDFATAINDCVNYIPKERLGKAFACVKSALNKNGIFLFDVSSERKFREKLAGSVSVDDRDDVTYMCFNSVEGDKVSLEVTLFEKRSDGAFDRKDETHIQYIYKVDEIKTALAENGFELLKCEGQYGTDINAADRICFLAQKR